MPLMDLGTKQRRVNYRDYPMYWAASPKRLKQAIYAMNPKLAIAKAYAPATMEEKDRAAANLLKTLSIQNPEWTA